MNRYPGTKPFTAENKSLFFGRNDEIESLYKFIKVDTLTVLYGKSGLGKTSLLNAGVIPLFINNQNSNDKNFPFSIRFGTWTENKKETPVEITKFFTSSNIPETNFLNEIVKDDGSLWYFLKKQQIDNCLKPCKVSETLQGLTSCFLLFFDQFEELFTYPAEQINDFKNQISDLLNSRIPQKFRTKIQIFLEENENFLTKEQLQLLYKPIDVKIVMSIRNDRMSELDKISDAVPNILQRLYELKPLTIKDAETAITKPANLPDSEEIKFISPQFKYEKTALKNVLNFLSNDKKQSVESNQLQILCQFCENIIIEKAKNNNSANHEITNSDLGNIKDIFTNHYNNILLKITDFEERKKAQIFIEETLIQENRRISLDKVICLKHISETTLNLLVDNRLIRPEINTVQGISYELSHDTLIEPILVVKQKRLLEEAEKEKLRVKSEELRIEKEKRNKIVSGIVVFGLILLTILYILLWNFYNILKFNKKLEISSLISESQKYSFTDDNKSFELAKEAYFKDTTDLSSKFNLIKNYYNSDVFYNIFFRSSVGGINCIQNSNNDKGIYISYNQFFILIDINGVDIKNLCAFPASFDKYFSIGFNDNYVIEANSRVYIKTENNFVIEIRKYENQVFSVEFSKDEQKIIVALESGDFEILTLKGELIDSVHLSDLPLYFATFSNDDNKILAACADNSAIIYNLKTKEKTVFEGHTREVNYAFFSPDENYIVTASKDSTARIWNIDGTVKTILRSHNENVTFANFSHNGKKIITCGNDKIARVWDLDGNLLYTLNGHERRINYAVFSDDDNFIYTASGDISQLDNTVRKWNIGSEKFMTIPLDFGFSDAIFSYDSKFMFVAIKNKVQKYDLKGNLQTEKIFGENQILKIAVSPDNNSILFLKSDSIIVADLDLNMNFEIFADTLEFSTAIFQNAKNEILVGCSNGNLLKIENGKVINNYNIHTAQINYISVSKDGKFIATASDDFTAKILNSDFEIVSELKSGNYITSINFSDDNKKIVRTSGDYDITIWDKTKDTTEFLKIYDNEVTEAKFIFDGNYLLSYSSAAREVKITDLQGNEAIAFPANFGTFIKSVQISNDGKYLLIGNKGFKAGDNSVKLFDLDVNEIIKKME